MPRIEGHTATDRPVNTGADRTRWKSYVRTATSPAISETLSKAGSVRFLRRAVLTKVGTNGEARTNFYVFLSDRSEYKWMVTCELWTVVANGQITIETRNLGTESGWPLASAPQAAATFTQVLGDFVVLAGGRQYKQGAITVFGESTPAFSAYIENGGFFVDTQLYYAQDKPPLKLVHNHSMQRPARWDANFDDSAIEVVDENNKPRFQLIYHDPHTIIIRGVFQFNNRVLVLEDKKSHFAVGSTDADMETSPLFKYPSRLYLGQEASPAPKIDKQ